jgi:hypothetical protein
VLLLGDLNILEPDHRPGYPFFAPFEYEFYSALGGVHGLTDAFRRLHPRDAEYSWVGRGGDGYRYHHAFCSGSLASQVTACYRVGRQCAGLQAGGEGSRTSAGLGGAVLLLYVGQSADNIVLSGVSPVVRTCDRLL